MRFFLAVSSLACLVLTGCTLSNTAAPVPEDGPEIRGTVHGGQQAVVGASVYLFAANTTGYGGSGIAPSAANASVSLLNANVLVNNLGHSGIDGNGNYYVTTDSTGSFTITGDYTCSAGQQVYLYAVGGNPGAGANTAAGFLAILGNCPGGNLLASIPTVAINEISTIAAAYSFEAFATDATHVSSSGTTLAKTDVANAFATAANLASISTGVALTTTPAGNGSVPQSTINTLANILASCVNSASSSSSNCGILFTNTKSGVTSATDTATAAIYMAQNPSANTSALYGLEAGVASPFTPNLVSSGPISLTLSLLYSGGGLGTTVKNYMAVDALGHIWISGTDSASLSEFSPVGAAISPTAGYTGGGLSSPTAIAIDNYGFVWVTDFNTASISEFYGSNASSPHFSGQAVSGFSGYNGGGVSYPGAIAVDPSGNIWTLNNFAGLLSKFYGSNAVSPNTPGQAISSSSGYTGGGLSASGSSIAIDTAGYVWVPSGNMLSEFTSLGTPVSSTGYSGSNLTSATAAAIDGSGNVLVTASSALTSQYYGSNAVSPNSPGEAISTFPAFSGRANGIYQQAPAIDGAANIYVFGKSYTSNYIILTIQKLSSTGAVLTAAPGYPSVPIDPPGLIFSYEALNLVLDGSGNMWLPLYLPGRIGAPVYLEEIVGAAAPVVTPIAANLIAPYGASAVNKP